MWACKEEPPPAFPQYDLVSQDQHWTVTRLNQQEAKQYKYVG